MSTLAHSPTTPAFEEVQRFRQPWLWGTLIALFGVVEVIALVAWLRTGSVGAMSAFIAAAAAEGPLLLLFALMSLRVSVDTEAVEIRFVPFLRRRIPLDDIRSAQPRTYRPIHEFGGWGIRFSFVDSGRAYNVSGNEGVQLELKNGKRVLIGSQRPRELADAITAARGA